MSPSRSWARALVAAPVVLLAAAVLVPAVLAQVAGVPTGRLAGPTRVETAIAISQRAFPEGAAVVYLASADSLVDAVAGGSLSDGPVLLVPGCELPESVAAEIARLGPAEVLALGGPAAVCDDVLLAAGEAAAEGGSDPGEGDQPDHVVTASAEIVDASSTPPFTVAATDPGILFEGGTAEHQVTFIGTDGRAVLDDPRFSGVLTDGSGQLVVAGAGCGPNVFDGQVAIACTEEFRFVEVVEGEQTPITVALHTDDEQVGETPLLPGTYVLDQPVRWDDDVAGPMDEAAFDDGSAIVRVTYRVTSPSGPDTPESEGERGTEVVEWSTPDGNFRTTGHYPADVVRIEQGIAAGEHIGIPNGRIHPGDGGINLGHDWHLTEVELADQTIEVCDGTAAYVDAHLADYLEIGHYCPWGAVPVAIAR